MADNDVPIYVSDEDSSSSDEASGTSVSGEESSYKRPALSEEQHQALEAARKGRNIFITGSAGVGKSFLLREILKVLPKQTSYVTASTGVAACNIGGTTLHSFAGIGLGDKPVPELVRKINSKYNDSKKRWLGCRVLVIDEISMIDGTLFEKVEKIARLVRKTERPFGDIQVILCGDFLQLPPVKSNHFAFETKAWSEVVDETIVLKKVFRQKEVGFITLLNRLRTGQFTQLDVEVLNTCRNTKFIDDGIKATRLFPHRYSCDDLNKRELRKLKGPPMIYDAVDGATKPMYNEMLDKNSKFVKKLELKCGAQVMLLVNKNVKGHLVNGARGVVIGFRDRTKSLEENLLNIQKQSGEDNDLGSIKNKDLFENTILHDELEGSDDEIADEVVEAESNFKRNPIVLFVNGVIDVVNPEKVTIDAAGKTVASRLQIPLSLAWAVSVHKSQGMTLDRIDVSLADSFEHGQSYVALSRVTSLDGLLLRDFKAKKITAHPKVLDYYKKYDPTFDKFTVEGDEQLRAFIERKKNGFQDVLKQIQARNENIASCSKNEKFLSPGPSTSRNLDFTPTPISNFSPLVPKRLTGTNDKLSNKDSIYNEKAFCTKSKLATSPKGEDTTSKRKDESTFTRQLASTSQALLKAETVLADCRKALQEASSGPSTFFANEEKTSLDIPKKKSDTGSIVVIDSDDEAISNIDCPSLDANELDATIFENDDFDVSLLKSTSLPVSNNFLDNICPDLLDSASSIVQDSYLNHVVKRKRSLEMEESEEKSAKKNNPLVEYNEDKIKILLKEKAAEIEKKKQAALERRRRSLQLSNK